MLAGECNHRGDSVGVTTDACVGRHPRLQVPRLADIERIALAVEHAIDAGLVRQQPGKAANRRRTAGRLGGRICRFLDGDPVFPFVLDLHGGLYVGKATEM